MIADTTPVLAPCPFCGHDTPEFERMGTSGQSCIVACGNCGARHESGDEYLQSGKSWNRRARAPAPQGPTNVEIEALWADQQGFHPNPVVFARAVLARWGAPAASGEPVALKPLTRPQIAAASREAQIQFCLDKQPTYEVALARAVETAHGIKP